MKLNIEITDTLIGYTSRCLRLIKILWCTFIACTVEQAYIPEFAYAFEYIIKNKGSLPMPKYDTSSIFPRNYTDFHYTKDVAAYFNEIMEGIF